MYIIFVGRVIEIKSMLINMLIKSLQWNTFKHRGGIQIWDIKKWSMVTKIYMRYNLFDFVALPPGARPVAGFRFLLDEPPTRAAPEPELVLGVTRWVP